jgi:hypothetical protein
LRGVLSIAIGVVVGIGTFENLVSFTYYNHNKKKQGRKKYVVVFIVISWSEELRESMALRGAILYDDADGTGLDSRYT